MSPKSADDILRVLQDKKAAEDLRKYFNGDPSPDLPFYTGSRFDALDGGGSRQEVRDVFTPADLLAVHCLSVVVPAAVGLSLVEGHLSEQLGRFLTDIPANLPLGEAEARRHVETDSPADKAWHLLRRQDDVGWVIAGKLLARKRPHLIPVWDNVVKCATGRPKNAWLWMDDLLHDAQVRAELDQLRTVASLPELVTRLRVLDVIIWMRHRPIHAKTGCAGMKTE